MSSKHKEVKALRRNMGASKRNSSSVMFVWNGLRQRVSLIKKIVLSNSKFSAAALNSISGTSGGKDIGYIRQQHHQVVAVTLTLYISCARLPTQPTPPHILTSKQHRQQQRLQQQQQLQHQQLLWSSVHWVPAATAPAAVVWLSPVSGKVC